jgi:hypothetical protein
MLVGLVGTMAAFVIALLVAKAASSYSTLRTNQCRRPPISVSRPPTGTLWNRGQRNER